MERNSVNDKRQEKLFYIGIVIFITIYIAIIVIDIKTALKIFTRFESIEIKSTSVSKSRYMYFVYINFVNTGTTSTYVDSVLLNGVHYDDPGWAGTLRPAVFGDLTPGSFINSSWTQPWYDPSGIIEFSDDCMYIPSGYRLTTGVTVPITIHTTAGKDYDTSVTLP